MQQPRLLGYTKFPENVLVTMANRLRDLEEINAVAVFPTGSNDKPSAICLLITSMAETCRDFIEWVDSLSQKEQYRHLSPSELRYTALCELDPVFAAWVKTQSDPKLLPHPHVDVLVVTTDWQKRLPYFELAYRSESTMFLQRLAHQDPLFVT